MAVHVAIMQHMPPKNQDRIRRILSRPQAAGQDRRILDALLSGLSLALSCCSFSCPAPVAAFLNHLELLKGPTSADQVQ